MRYGRIESAIDRLRAQGLIYEGVLEPPKGKILAGSTVEILEVKAVGNSKWGRVTQGWICMDYVILDGQKEETPSDSKTIIADCLRVRETASTSAKIVGYYYQNAKVQILETQTVDGTTWGKTSKGWISMDYVK